MSITGSIIGYDPGGNDKNGIAVFEVYENVIKRITIKTLSNAESVITYIDKTPNIIGLGVDTLSCWCTGHSGWRPADTWLKNKYPEVEKSVASPNSLFGAMSLNGMSVLIYASKNIKDLIISETHPKVLYHALTHEKYNYKNDSKSMDNLLSKYLSCDVHTENDHEWDAVISAYALLKGMNGDWRDNLHNLPLLKGSRLIEPCGKTLYYWPQ